jgi:hypothetical protein
VGQREEMVSTNAVGLTLRKPIRLLSHRSHGNRPTPFKSPGFDIYAVMPLSSRNLVLAVSRDLVSQDLVTHIAYGKTGPNDAAT